MPLSLPPLHGNPSTTRHRSGSVTLAFERNNGNGVGVGGTTVSGGTDLLGDGSSSSSMAPPAAEAATAAYDIQQPHQADSTIASTLASLGLDDDQPGSFTGNNGTRGEDDIGINNSNGRTRSRGYSTLPALSITPESSNHHHPSVMAASSSSAGRTRAYTVGPERPNISRLLAPTAATTTAMRFDPFENDTAASSPFAQPPPLASFQKPSNQHHQSLVANRPRAVSLGVANHHGPPPPPSTHELLSLGGRPYHTSTTSTAGSPLRSSRSSTNLMMMMMTADQNEEQVCKSPWLYIYMWYWFVVIIYSWMSIVLVVLGQARVHHLHRLQLKSHHAPSG